MSSKHKKSKNCRNCSPASYQSQPSSYNKTANPAMKQKALSAHSIGSTVAQSANFAGVSERTIYNWRDQDPGFAQAWDQGRDHLLEGIEAQAFKQAMHGDRQLLIFLLKAHKPELYGARPRPAQPAPTGMDIDVIEGIVSSWQ